jgi:hypothetical protein
MLVNFSRHHGCATLLILYAQVADEPLLGNVVD